MCVAVEPAAAAFVVEAVVVAVLLCVLLWLCDFLLRRVVKYPQASASVVLLQPSFHVPESRRAVVVVGVFARLRVASSSGCRSIETLGKPSQAERIKSSRPCVNR